MSSTLTYFNPVSGQMEQEKGIGNMNYNKYWSTAKTNEMNYVLNERNNQLQQDLSNQANVFTQSERIAQNEWNREQELDARAFNIQMRDEQREYDSPEAQMQRLIQAGINPNMVAQGLGGSSGGSSPVVQGSPADSASNSQGQLANTNPALMQAPSGLNSTLDLVKGIAQIFGEVSGAVQAGTGAWNEATIAKHTPELIFNQKKLMQTQESLTSVLHQTYLAQLPFAGFNADMQGQLALAEKEIKKWTAYKEKAGTRYLNEMTFWLPQINDKKIEEMTKGLEISDKVLEKYDEDIRFVVQEIAESRSREALNYGNRDFVKENERGTKLRNDLVEKYGEEKTARALQAYDDAHAESMTNRFFQMFQVEPRYRGRVYNAMVDIGALPLTKQKEFWKTLESIRVTHQIPPTDKLFGEIIDKLLDSNLVGLGAFE